MKFHEWPAPRQKSFAVIGGMRRVLWDDWFCDCRPYYKCFPAVIDTLTKMRLDVALKDAKLQERVVLIRFADGKEPKSGCLTLLACLTEFCFWEGQPEEAKGVLLVEALVKYPTEIASCLRWWREEDPGTIEDLGKEMESREDCVANYKQGTVLEKDERDLLWMATRASFAVHLLADDPSIITPDVLSRDRDRYDRETDEAWKQRAVDRARRRGVVGWNIGADYEVCPHYRRPHFGLRHTGKGGTVPRIVPIKGAVVHRSRLTEVPTGWMTQDGREVEPNEQS